MRVVISNCFSDRNRGSAALTIATIELVRRALPDAAITLIAAGTNQPERDFEHTLASAGPLEILPAPIPRERGFLGAARTLATGVRALGHLVRRPTAGPASLQRILEADLLLSKAGAAMFLDPRGARTAFAFCVNTFPLMFAARWRIPTALSGAEVGPVEHALSRLLQGFVLRRMDLVMVRNQASQAMAFALGARSERTQLVPDSAFHLVPAAPERSAQLAARFGLVARRFAVLTLGFDYTLPGLDRFASTLGVLLRQLLDAAIIDQVVLVLHESTASDRRLSRRFVERLGDPRIAFVEDELSPAELIALNGAAAFNLGMRLHSMIFALIAGTPCFPVAASAKFRRQFDDLGLTDWLVDFPAFAVEPVFERIRAAVAGGDTLRAELSALAGRQRDGLAVVVERLRSLRARNGG